MIGDMRYVPFLVLAGGTFIVYLNSFWGTFQFDDYNVIVYSKTVHTWQAWSSGLMHGIRPALKFSYLLNWISGAGLFGFHLVNVAVHIANAVMVYLLALRLASYGGKLNEEQSIRVALATALLFALHPVQTESVTYISGRSSSLMAFFYMASVLTYPSALISPVLFVIALLSKETAVTLPFALLLMDRGNTLCAGIKKQAVHWFLLIGALTVLMAHPGHGGLLEYSFDIRGMYENLLTQISGIVYLLSRLFALNGMNIDPDLPVISSWTPLLIAKAASLSGVMLSGVLVIKRRPLTGIGILWFFLHLLTTNSIVPRLDVANERHLYLASVGLFLAAASEFEAFRNFLTARNAGAGGLAALAGILVPVVLGAFTISRNHDYRSETALWEDTAAESPLKARVHNNLGYAYYLEGRAEEAKKAYMKALELRPDYAMAKKNLDRADRYVRGR